MPAWGLKLGALLTTLLVLGGSYGYARDHVKNPNAPLQPPVADKGTTAPAPTATPTPIPSLVGTRRGNPTRPAGSPAPLLNLQPAVHATALPQVTFTHVS